MADRNDDLFAPFFVRDQRDGYCGPASLASCIYLLRNELVTQTEVARVAGRGPREGSGTDQTQLQKAASDWKVSSTLLRGLTRHDGQSFVKTLREHLVKGLPALLYIEKIAHWVAVLTYFADQDQFIIMDPIDADRPFNKWQTATLLGRARGEAGAEEKHFALLLARTDGMSPSWRLTPSLVRLCEGGAGESAADIVRDLEEIGRRAGTGNGSLVGRWDEALRGNSAVVLKAVDHWIGDKAESKAAVQALYDAYVTVAEAAGLAIPTAANAPEVIAQLTAIFAEYAARGR